MLVARAIATRRTDRRSRNRCYGCSATPVTRSFVPPHAIHALTRLRRSRNSRLDRLPNGYSSQSVRRLPSIANDHRNRYRSAFYLQPTRIVFRSASNDALQPLRRVSLKYRNSDRPSYLGQIFTNPIYFNVEPRDYIRNSEYFPRPIGKTEHFPKALIRISEWMEFSTFCQVGRFERT